MKKLLLIGCFLASTHCFAQKGKVEYVASNSLTYHVGDTVVMGKGSGVNGEFLYLSMTGLLTAMSYNSNRGADQLNASRGYANGKGIIKKIKELKFAGNIKPYFILDFGVPTKFNLFIEDAIVACEITPCITK